MSRQRSANPNQIVASGYDACGRRYTEDDFFGATMYWSNCAREEYERTVVDLGFEIRARGWS